MAVVLTCAPRGLLAQQASAPAAPAAASSPAAMPAVAGLLDPLLVLQSPTASQIDRDEAARRLGQRQTSEARQALAAVLTDVANRPGQLAVARAVALDANPDPGLVNPLFALVASQQPALADAAITALANYRNQPDVHDQLIKLATDGQRQRSEAVRLAAIRSVATMSDAAAVGAMVDLVSSDEESAAVRDAAATALADMTGAASGRRDAGFWREWWNVNRNRPTLEHDLLLARAARLDVKIRRAEHALNDMQAKLAEVYQLVPDTQKEGVLLKYLRGGEPETRVVGAQLVQDDFKQLRQPTPAVRNQLRMMISDSSSQVRVAVAQALFVLNDDQAIGALLDQVGREGDPDVRIALARALAPTRDPRVIEPLLKLLSDPSPAVVEVAAKQLSGDDLAPLIQKDASLSQRVAREMNEALKRVTAGEGGGGVPLRAALVDAMGATHDPGMLETYRALVEQRGEAVPVKAAALRALGQLGPAPGPGRISPAVVIVRSLKDRDDTIRLEAVRALRTTADVIYAEDIFQRILPGNLPDNEPNGSIREEAWAVLRNLFEQANVKMLSNWADRAVIKQAPERRIEICKALVKKFIAQNDDANLATYRQNIGQDLMSLSDTAAQAGDAELAKARAKEADLYFKPALDYYTTRQPHNEAMIAGALIERRADALLAAGDYDAAADFAETQIEQNPANREALGAKLRNEVDRLRKAGRLNDALRLIDAIKKRRVQLPARDLNFINQVERELRGGVSAVFRFAFFAFRSLRSSHAFGGDRPTDLDRRGDSAQRRTG